ncbi:AAA domain-containing protein [Pseudomonas jessenii]|uniref:ATP-dependent nuclease n=1 Tax=Pseudomonas jessenii TaxID=77298 RepID=UPI0039DFAD94
MPPKKRKPTNSEKPLASFMLGQNDASTSNAQAFIVPTNTKFNDFGFIISCKVGFRDTHGEIHWLEGRCAIKDEINTYSAIKGRMRPSQTEIYTADLDAPFRTLLTDTKSYSFIRRVLGEERGRLLLSSLQDIAIRYQGYYSNDWSDFYKEEVFSHAMIRSSEAYFAYRIGDRVMKGLPQLDADTRQPFAVDLKGSGPITSFDFQFDSHNFLRGRISVLIGQNGCGKTSALSKISKALADSASKSAVVTNRPEVNQVVAFIHTASIKQFVPSSKKALPKARIFTFNPGSPRKHSDDSITTLLVDVARRHDIHGPSLSHFSEILESEFSDLQLLIPVKTNPKDVRSGEFNYLPFDKWSSGGEEAILRNASAVSIGQPLIFQDRDGQERKLSLGQLSFIRFILTALANAGPASVLIIDEPENFLHPNLISRFMRSLNKILSGTQSIAIIATHSPFVVREVQSKQVHVMRQEDGVLTVRKPLMQTLGSNVSSISNEVFGDDLPEHLYEELLEVAKRESSSFDDAIQKYGSELSVEALMLLRRMMDGSINA